MIGKVFAITAGAALGATALPPAQDAPLAPTGKWVAQFEDSVCVLSRGYAVDGEPVVLAFRPLAGGDRIEILLILPYSGRPFSRWGEAEVRLGSDGERVKVRDFDYTQTGGKRIVRMWPMLAELGDLEAAESIGFKFGGKSYRFALTSTAKAMRTIGVCQDRLVRSWGYDPDALRALSAKAEPISPERWITDSDYPASALASRESGSVRVRYAVDAEGKPKDCAVIMSSGWSDLDRTTCALLMSRGRFRPAKDAEGNPALSLRTDAVSWIIPS